MAKGNSNQAWRAGLVLFIIQLVFNALWSAFFFGLRSPLGGLIIIIVLWLLILFTIIAFFRVSRTAGFLMLPYILWVTFASVLNAAIWILNR
jgi:tryptophan-rich sensory protein